VVTGDDGVRNAVGGRDRRPATADRVSVDDVVVHEGRGVQVFQAEYGADDVRRVPADGFRGMQRHHRPEQLAGGEQRIAGDFGEPLGRLRPAVAEFPAEQARRLAAGQTVDKAPRLRRVGNGHARTLRKKVTRIPQT
jgi:hypothetical protein